MSSEDPSLKLQLLEKEFNLVMMNYDKTYKDYISYLESLSIDASSGRPNERNFIVINGKTFLGEKGIDEKASKSVDECQALCMANEKCSGALFNSRQELCLLRSGKGNIMKGGENDTAIVDKIYYYMSELKGINELLIEINRKIQREIDELRPIISDKTNENKNKAKELVEIYNKLMDDKKNIDVGIQKYNTLNQGITDSTLEVDREYRLYHLFLVIVIIVLVVTIGQLLYKNSKEMVGGGSGKYSSLHVQREFLVIILLFLLVFILKNVYLYLLWAFCVIGYVVYTNKKIKH